MQASRKLVMSIMRPISGKPPSVYWGMELMIGSTLTRIQWLWINLLRESGNVRHNWSDCRKFAADAVTLKDLLKEKITSI